MNKIQGEWIVNLEDMHCINSNNGIIVNFEKNGNSLIGKINDISVELLEQWMEIPNCHKFMQKAIMEAEEVFFRVHFENELKKNERGNCILNFSI